MPHALSLTDGTTTVSLSTTNVMLSRYFPEAPQWDDRSQAYKQVTESIEVFLYDSTPANVQAKQATIERLLHAANMRQSTGRGPKVFLTYQLSSDGAAWRSEVLHGRMRLDSTAAQGLPQSKLTAEIIVTRLPYWEGARTQLALSNPNGSSTSGVTVFNANDGSGSPPNDRVNYVNVTGVAGVLPAPVELHMTNATGGSVVYSTFHVANNAFGSTPEHVIEGEAYVPGYGSAGSDSSCSGGQYGRRTSAGAQTVVFRYSIPTVVLNAYAGRLCKVLARFRALPGTREVRLRLYEGNGLSALGPPSPVTVIEGGLFSDPGIRDLGSVQLPPGEYTAGWDPVVLEIQMGATGAETFDLDYIQLTPAEPLCYRRLQQRGFTIANGETIVDDGIEGKVYALDGSAVTGGLWIQLTEPLHVFPGVTQRFIFLHDISSGGGGAAPTLKLTVKAFYRPRRLTI